MGVEVVIQSFVVVVIGGLGSIWGAFIGLEFFTTFIGPGFWGKEAEERIARLQESRSEAVNRIDWVIDSLHNLIESDA